jgi:hypothetical protein
MKQVFYQLECHILHADEAISVYFKMYRNKMIAFQQMLAKSTNLVTESGRVGRCRGQVMLPQAAETNGQ